MASQQQKYRVRPLSAVAVLALLGIAGCTQQPPPSALDPETPPRTLSAYGLFAGALADHRPTDGVIPYDVNSELFSDYTLKYRFVRQPPGMSATYDDTEAFSLPVGTLISKTFAVPHDRRDPSKGQRLIETRILWHKPDGWTGLPYVWNEEQTEAHLRLAGGTADVSWVHDDGSSRTNNYIIPNANQCRACHNLGESMAPIGLKARHLNREYRYPDGTVENQLAHWTQAGALRGAPPPKDAPRLPVWNDPATGDLAQRARAWLEINCAHCHNPRGAASNAGLDLTASQTEPTRFGVFKPPVAAGQGSGGRKYSIVPGRPDESILAYRIASVEAQVMMPELGKRLVHVEGVELVRRWIADMDHPDTTPRP